MVLQNIIALGYVFFGITSLQQAITKIIVSILVGLLCVACQEIRTRQCLYQIGLVGFWRGHLGHLQPSVLISTGYSIEFHPLGYGELEGHADSGPPGVGHLQRIRANGRLKLVFHVCVECLHMNLHPTVNTLKAILGAHLLIGVYALHGFGGLPYPACGPTLVTLMIFHIRRIIRCFAIFCVTIRQILHPPVVGNIFQIGRRLGPFLVFHPVVVLSKGVVPIVEQRTDVLGRKQTFIPYLSIAVVHILLEIVVCPRHGVLTGKTLRTQGAHHIIRWQADHRYGTMIAESAVQIIRSDKPFNSIVSETLEIALTPIHIVCQQVVDNIVDKAWHIKPFFYGCPHFT